MKRLPSGYTPPRLPTQAAPTLPLAPRRSSDDDSPVDGLTFTPISVSRMFREALADEYPGLGQNRAYWRFLQYLCFGTWRDVENGQLLLPQSLIAAITDQPCDSNFSASKFFDAFSWDVGIKVDIADKIFHPDPVRSRSRSLKTIHLPNHITALVSMERSRLDDDRVWMDTGHKWLRKHTSERRGEDRERAEGLLGMYQGCPETVALAEYLNGLPPNRFSSVLRHLPEAMEYATALADSENQANLLKAIREQVQPFYSSVERSTRVFAVKDSILRLHRDLRKILTQDWVTADLRSAQLAIVAKIWDVPEIEAYLDSGRSIWEDLCEHMGIAYTSDNKALVKTPLYSITFGAGKGRVRSIFAKSFPDGRVAYDRFKTHPIIRALLRSRSRQLREIRNAEGGTDAFGRVLALEKRHKPGYTYLYDNSRSILACIAQSYELKLLLPVIQLSIAEQYNDHGFSITTFLHDGFTFDSFKSRDRQRWKNKISDLVKEEAERLGIHTELEFGYDSSQPVLE